MKKTLLTLTGLIAALALQAQTFRVVLAWDPNPETDIAGYTIYSRQMPGGTYTPAVTVTNGTTATVTNLALGSTWCFVATAFNTSGLESDYSNEVCATMPTNPAAPSTLRIEMIRKD